MNIDLTLVVLALAHVILGVLVLIVAKFLGGALTPYRTDEEMTLKDNPAFGLAVAGYYLAVTAIYIGAVRAAAIPEDAGTTGALAALGMNFLWAIAGVVALAGSRWLMSMALVGGMRCSNEIKSNRNTAAGAVECGVYLASGIVLAGALREPGGTVWTALVFFVLSQVVLLLLGRLYQRLAGYAIAQEICAGNLAAGAAFALTLIALSLLLFKAASGEFVDWGTNLSYFAFDAAVGFVLLMALRWLTDVALLPDARIADEIVRDRNVNVGLLEGSVAVSVAALILFVF
jgi:uncharacterized membrane protein YjfL (UPF0719 family)